MDNRWQLALLAGLVIVMVAVGLLLVRCTYGGQKQKAVDEWDFDGVTHEGAYDLLREAAATRPRGTWFLAMEGSPVRLTDAPDGRIIVELASNITPWPKAAGDSARLEILRVHRRQTPIRSWIIDVTVGDDGELPLVYDARTHDVPDPLVCTEMRAENLARWAKKIHAATLPLRRERTASAQRGAAHRRGSLAEPATPKFM